MRRTKTTLVGAAIAVISVLTALSAGPAQSASARAEDKGTIPAVSAKYGSLAPGRSAPPKIIGSPSDQRVLNLPPEILWHNTSNNETQIWHMDDNRISSRQGLVEEDGSLTHVGPPWQIVGVADFGGRTNMDVLWHNASTNETQIWYMNGYRIDERRSVLEEGGSPTHVGAPWEIAGTADFDQSGSPDILWHNTSTNETQIWYMFGNSIRSRRSVLEEGGSPTHVGAPWEIAGVAGVNPYGGTDIFWHNTRTNETQIWYMNGNSRIAARRRVLEESGSPTHVGAPWEIAGTADFDQHGSPDILWHNTSTNETQIWYMNGNRIDERRDVLEQGGSPTRFGTPWQIAGIGD
ncbi:hypothetical protein ACFW7J_05440 [Streptomyces sp. NPDC059525]|uniref:hypothetical protein n=1 Tax=Streptomyces sp. NPDC059525 TaxID=3346857 RepID=UPI0036BD1F32